MSPKRGGNIFPLNKNTIGMSGAPPIIAKTKTGRFVLLCILYVRMVSPMLAPMLKGAYIKNAYISKEII